MKSVNYSNEEKSNFFCLCEIQNMVGDDEQHTGGVNSNHMQLVKILKNSVATNNVEGTQFALAKIYACGLSLMDLAFRDTVSNATVLHAALLEECWDVSKCLLTSNKEPLLLTDVCRVRSTSISHSGLGKSNRKWLNYKILITLIKML